MATPFNRKKTIGAFGSRKIQPVGHHYEVLLNERAEAVPAEKKGEKSGPNIANIIIDFARPIIAQAGGNHTAIKGAMNVAILLWNSFVAGEDAVSAAREKLLTLPDAVPEQIDDLIKTLRERKELVGKGVNVSVAKYDMNFTKHGINFSITAANAPLEGVQKSPILSALGNAPAKE